MGIESFIKSVCVQTAVYWAQPQSDGFGGVKTAMPVEIPVRWTEKQMATTPTSSQGATKAEINIINAEILSPNDVQIGGYLWLGTLEELETKEWPNTIEVLSPLQIAGAFQIKSFVKTPMIKSKTVFVRLITV